MGAVFESSTHQLPFFVRPSHTRRSLDSGLWLVESCEMISVNRMRLALQHSQHWRRHPRLSCRKTIRANSCRAKRPKTPHSVCISRISIARRSSFLGPNQTSHRFKIVKLVDSTISPLLFLFILSSVTGNLSSRFRNKATDRAGGSCHEVIEGSKRPVRALKLGRRCRGQGMRRNSCGAE